LIASME